MKQRTIFNGGNWTPARFNSFVTSILRSGSRRWPPKFQALNEAKTEKRINPASGRLAQHFMCASCGKEHVAANVQVDHIQPMGYNQSWDDWINGLYCEKENLQVLCKPCHKIKTQSEKKSK